MNNLVRIPESLTLPVVSGTTLIDGSSLSTTPGTWTNSPTSFAYQWEADGIFIGGATSSTWEKEGAHDGKEITVHVIATNAGGDSLSISSDHISPITIVLPAPVNTVAPVITGTVVVDGTSLSTTNGTWTPPFQPTFTYQWKRGAANISGATSSTYVKVPEDRTENITCVVTGTNSGGSDTGTSNVIGPITYQPQPSFSNVTYLANHEDATDATTVLLDIATGGVNNPNVMVFGSGAENDSAQTRFGSGTSVLFDDSSQGTIRASLDPDFTPSSSETNDTGEFCWEAHFRLSSLGSQQCIYSRYDATGNQRAWFLQVDASNIVRFAGWNNGTDLIFLIVSSAISVDTWYHVAVTRENDFSVDAGAEDIVRLFLDGVLVDSDTLATAEGFTEHADVPFARWGEIDSGGQDLDGWIDNIRITMGEPVYVAEFDVLTARHPTS